MKKILSLFFLMFLLAVCSAVGQDDAETCLSCHDDEDLTGFNAGGDSISVYFPIEKFSASVHEGMECVECHVDLEGNEDYPHEETLQPVDCMLCHDDVESSYEKSIHGQNNIPCKSCHGYHTVIPPSQAIVGDVGIKCNTCHRKIASLYNKSMHGRLTQEKNKLAPKCWDCHGSHDILKHTDPQSPVVKFNIPFMCGKCHKEGSPVTEKYDIPEDSVLFHYSQSIHGKGLFQRGLVVTAVCSDCHTAHNVRNHTDPESSINRNNVAKTCEKCHGQIEQVHRKVIRGELWQKEPNKVPVCVDCHSPHKIRRVFYEEGVSDKECLACHAKKDLYTVRGADTLSLYVDSLEAHGSIHRNISCAQCHTGISPGKERPCKTVINKVDCSICHSEVVAIYKTSIHGKLADRGDTDAPTCVTCHGTHNILDKRNVKSPTFPRYVPELCSKCHQRKGVVSKRKNGKDRNIVQQYEMSIHGKGLLESGLVVTAMCSDCHTAHHILPEKDPASSVNHDNIPNTCAKCHDGIKEEFDKSIHSPLVSKTDKPLPICSDCHHSHTITRVDKTYFRLKIEKTCGKCHEDVTKTYFETIHGKVSKLGYAAAAQCYDCHGSHKILPPDDPNSSLSMQNIVTTCAKCHTNAHRQFAGYLTHATHHDRIKYPILYYTFWFMTILLVSTLIIFGIHTILWLPRSFQAMKKHKIIQQKSHMSLQYQRFKPLNSVLHVIMVISFLGLAVTGMTLKFSYLSWAQTISAILGGFESTGYIHRICAILTFLYFGIHITDLVIQKRKKHEKLFNFLLNPNSMLPNKNDLKELVGTIKWFLGLGPRPQYGRWTYWEKFDYFAVFWGVMIIGATGLILWFPELFTRILPGWVINVATIIHSDEALLATGFIFTIHFFNTHFRPDKFPMDVTIFTGRVPIEELKDDRPREYQELMQSRKIKQHLVKPLPKPMIRIIKVFGAAALLTGLLLILLIIYAEIFAYR